MLVQLDFDGCIMDFKKAFCLHTGLKFKSRGWYFYREQMSDQQFVDIISNAPAVFDGPAFVGAVAAVNKIAEHSETVIVTDRPSTMVDQTRQWLDRHGLQHIEFLISKDKTVLNPGIAVDDRLENVIAMRAAGIDAYLLRRDWNRSGKDLPSVKDMKEFATIVTESNHE